MFGLVQSKDAKVWCSVWVLGVGAKQGCKARVLSKQASKDKQPSKGLVLGAGAVRVYLSKLRLGVLCGCPVGC